MFFCSLTSTKFYLSLASLYLHGSDAFLVERITAYLNADAPVAGDSPEHIAIVENVYLFRWRI